VRASLLGALGALALIAGGAAAWQILGALGLVLAAVAAGGLALLVVRRQRIVEAITSVSMPRTPSIGRARRTPIVLIASLAVGAWLAATVFTLVSLPSDALPPSGERVAELETNVDGLVAAVGLLGGGDGTSHDDGPPSTPAFPIAGPDSTASPTSTATLEAMPDSTPEAEPTFLPTLEPTPMATTEATPLPTAASSFDFYATSTPTSTSTPATGATPSPLSQPRVTSGPGGGPLDTAGANLYNCTDFETWEQAVAVFRASGASDPNLLDTDGNGIPCEDLKAAELSRG